MARTGGWRRTGRKLQATGVDRAGRRRYLYQPQFSPQQEKEKFDKLVRFAERLPGLRRANQQAHGPRAFRPGADLRGRKRLTEYIREYLGEEFTAKEFRTWGGTLLAAIALAERGPPETETEAKRALAAVMRTVGERLGNTPAVARSSHVSPAVVEQYLDGRTMDDFRPRHLRVVGARDTGPDLEERAVLALLRSWRIRRTRHAT